MKNILIMLLLTAGCAAVGFMATAEISRRVQNAHQDAEQAKLAAADSNDQAQQMSRSVNYMGDAMENLRKRQTYAFIGAGVGAVIGFSSALVITSRTKKKPVA